MTLFSLWDILDNQEEHMFQGLFACGWACPLTHSIIGCFCDSSINTPLCLTYMRIHTHTHSCTYSLLYFRFPYLWGIPKVRSYVAGNSWTVNKCVFWEVESLVDSIGLSAGDWSLFVRGRREDRREYLPMSLPSPECFSAAHLL